jgi:hypothetical protein
MNRVLAAERISSVRVHRGISLVFPEFTKCGGNDSIRELYGLSPYF